MASVPLEKVSVALCTYNGGRFLAEQLLSITQQTRPVDEVIIADDGSSDDTMAVVADFVSHTSIPVAVLEPSERLGVAANFQRALEATTGDVVFTSDQDDVWAPDKVELMLSALSSTGAWVAHSDSRLIGADGSDLGLTGLESLRLTQDERAALTSGRPFSVLLRRNLVTGTTMAMRREAITTALPIPRGWIHDEWIAIMASALGSTVFVDRPLVHYRQHGCNEIGMARPSLRHRIDRVLQPRGSRVQELASRASILAARLDDAGAEAVFVDRARAKQRFEERRSHLPRLHIARVPTVVAMAVRRDYPLFASQSWWDIVRDLLQPT